MKRPRPNQPAPKAPPANAATTLLANVEAARARANQRTAPRAASGVSSAATAPAPATPTAAKPAVRSAATAQTPAEPVEPEAAGLVLTLSVGADAVRVHAAGLPRKVAEAVAAYLVGLGPGVTVTLNATVWGWNVRGHGVPLNQAAGVAAAILERSEKKPVQT